MKITELYQNLSSIQDRPCMLLQRDGTLSKKQYPILCKHMIHVYINEQLTMKLVCIPEHLTELVLGRLYTEGFVDSVEDIETIYICEYGAKARVFIRKSPKRTRADYVEITPTCCTDNHILNDQFLSSANLYPVIPIHWTVDDVFSLADQFANGMPLHEQTWATHSCFLASEGKTLFSCEDIGRHNALDKVIGYALRNGIDLKKCMVYSSGRIPTDMVVKAIRAGIPVLISKASPTTEAIALADTYQLTLICAARRDSMKLYSGMLPE